MAITTIDTTQVRDNSIVDADISSSAAIAGTKISPDFGVQNLVVDTNTLFVNATTNRVGVGTASPSALIDCVNNAGSGANRQIVITNYSTNASDGGTFKGRRSRGTVGAESAVLIGDSIASFIGGGYGASSFFGQTALIDMVASENWSNTTLGTDIIFTNTPNLSAAGAERMRILNSGFVGIGIAAPETMLDVYSTGGAGRYLRSRVYSSTGSDAGGLQVYRSSGAGTLSAVASGIRMLEIGATGYGATGWIAEPSAAIRMSAEEGFTDTNYGGRIHFFTKANAGGAYAERMRISNSGLVGIGIGSATPACMLDVTSDSSYTSLARKIQHTVYSSANLGASFTGRAATGSIASPGAVAVSQELLTVQAHGYYSTGGTPTAFSSGVGRGGFAFIAAEAWTNLAQGTFFNINTTAIGTTGPQTRMTISDAGLVGIGTQSPLSMLDVAGGVAIGSYAGTVATASGNLIAPGLVGIGLSAPANKLDIVSDNLGASRYVSHTVYESTTTGYGASFQGRRARGTVAVPLNVNANDNLVTLQAHGFYSITGTPTGFTSGGGKAQISLRAAEAWTSATNNGTFIEFSTTPVGSASSSVKMVFSDAGKLGVGSNATPSKTLDVVGDIRVNTNAGLYLGRFTTAQETTLVSGLVSADGGVQWFNTDEGQFKGWNGTAVVILG